MCQSIDGSGVCALQFKYGWIMVYLWIYQYGDIMGSSVGKPIAI